MPYTPPSNRSPATSAPTSPDVSRRPSFHQHPSSNTRPTLPRSASYLTKHRRTPSAAAPSLRETSEPSPESTSEDLRGMVASISVRQSPPPITSDRGMPKGAIISPPDTSSDDDDLPEVRIQDRGKKMEGDLKALHDAISLIPQNRSSSPTKGSRKDMKSPGPRESTVSLLQTGNDSEGMPHSLSTSSLDDLVAGGNRRFSHTRSATEPNFQLSESVENSLTGSEEDSDGERPQKPQMVRKKSGELVRPALRPPSRRRPSSMPGTPTFSKAVHFDSHLEHVRHFLQVDRPLAVSTGTSPVENYESDAEYPFGGDNRTTTRSPSFEWEIVMNNFPVETPARKAQPVRLERVWLSSDQKCLIGSVAVANIAFQKSVTCRFTLDYWKTTSEVGAEYMTEIRPIESPVSRDRFQFTIKLSDLANLESKTLYFCIRYNVLGQEHWDNNGGMNFQADFRKKASTQTGKIAAGATPRVPNGLPKSTRRANPSTSPRPKSVPLGSNDFGDGSRLNFDQSIHEYLGESAPGSIRLKGIKSSANIPSDNLSSRLSTPSGQAFANRYDFGASLTAAIQSAKDQLADKPDGLYMKGSKKPTLPTSHDFKNPATSARKQTTPPTSAKAPASTASKTTTPSGADSPSASISSSSYEELVNKYCFFGTKQTGPSRFDGGDDGSKSPNSSTLSSYEGSPIQMGNYHHHPTSAQHHTLHFKDPNPYFQRAGEFVSVGVSSSEPLKFSPTSRALPSIQANNRSPPPASSVGNFVHFTGTSSNEYPYQHLNDRFPFSGTETHPATAISS